MLTRYDRPDREDIWFQEGPDWDDPFNPDAGGGEQKLPSASEVKTALRNGDLTLEQAQEFMRQINKDKPSFVINQALAELQTIAAEGDPAGALAGNYGDEAQKAAEEAHQERLDKQQAEATLDPRDAAAAVLGGFMSEEQAIAQIQQGGEFKSASAARAELNRLIDGGRNKDGSLSSDMEKRINAVGGRIQTSQEGAISGALGGLGQADQLGATTPFPVLGDMPLMESFTGGGGGTGEGVGPKNILQALDSQYQRVDTGDLGQYRWDDGKGGRIVSYDGGRSFVHEFIDPESGNGMRAYVGFNKGQLGEGLAQRSHAVTRLALSPNDTGITMQPFANVEGGTLQDMLEGISGLQLTEDLPDTVDLFSEFDPARSKYTMTPAADRSVLAQTLDNLGLRRPALAEALGRSPTLNELHNLGSVRNFGLRGEPITMRNLAALQQTGKLYSAPKANPDLVMQPFSEPGASAAERAYGVAESQAEGQLRQFPTGGSVTAEPSSNAEAALALEPFGDFDTLNRYEKQIFDAGQGEQLGAFYRKQAGEDVSPDELGFLANYPHEKITARTFTNPNIVNRLPYQLNKLLAPGFEREEERRRMREGFSDPASALRGLISSDPLLQAEYDRLNFLRSRGGAGNLANVQVGLAQLLDQLIAREGYGEDDARANQLRDALLGGFPRFNGGSVFSLNEGGEMMTDEPVVGVGALSGQPVFTIAEGERMNIEPVEGFAPEGGRKAQEDRVQDRLGAGGMAAMMSPAARMAMRTLQGSRL